MKHFLILGAVVVIGTFSIVKSRMASEDRQKKRIEISVPKHKKIEPKSIDPKPTEMKSTEPKPMDATGAIYVARTAVKRFLKAPSTAKFPTADDSSYSVRQRGIAWIVDGIVEAKNPLGVPLVSRWRVMIAADTESEKTAAVYVKIGNDILLNVFSPEELDACKR